MIDPKELRIGNLFYPINRHTEIHLPITKAIRIEGINRFEVLATWADKPFLKDNPRAYKTSDISPIPLTPEILEKCEGYAYNKDIGYHLNANTHKLGIGHTTFLFSEVERADGSFELELEVAFFAADDYRSINYNPFFLHEIQNLYYALAREELIIRDI